MKTLQGYFVVSKVFSKVRDEYIQSKLAKAINDNMIYVADKQVKNRVATLLEQYYMSEKKEQFV